MEARREFIYTIAIMFDLGLTIFASTISVQTRNSTDDCMACYGECTMHTCALSVDEALQSGCIDGCFKVCDDKYCCDSSTTSGNLQLHRGLLQLKPELLPIYLLLLLIIIWNKNYFSVYLKRKGSLTIFFPLYTSIYQISAHN